MTCMVTQLASGRAGISPGANPDTRDVVWGVSVQLRSTGRDQTQHFFCLHLSQLTSGQSNRSTGGSSCVFGKLPWGPSKATRASFTEGDALPGSRVWVPGASAR